VLVGIALVAAVGYAIVRQWTAVRDTITAIPWPSLVLAFVAALAGMTCNVMAWRQVLHTLGHTLTPAVAGRCYLVGGLGKYLPGSVWAFVLQMELAKRAGVPRANGFAATLIALGLATATAVVIGIPALPDLLSLGGPVPWLVLLIIPIAIVCALPPVLSRLVNLVLRLLRRNPLPHGLSWADTGRAVAWCALAWVLFGTHLWLLATSESAAGLPGLLRCIGAFALAMTAGLLAAFAPSGIGVREAVIVAALSPFVPIGVALGIALASRLVFTVADLTAAGAAALSGVRLRHTAEVAD
jgi:uncharacterized membrane protein YbhN (UPF0104 family)